MTKIVKPSNSYAISLPDDVIEQYDGVVFSFWQEGKPCLLQLSSYLRVEGVQVAAEDRLRDRIAKQRQSWHRSENLSDDLLVDQATAEYHDEAGLAWIHTYLVWPHLTIYATISGPRELISSARSWPFAALKSIELTVH